MTPFETPHHVCLIVYDVDRTVAFYESVGIGPWLDYPPLDEYTRLEVPDESAFRAMRFRACQIGPLQLQVGQPGHGDSPYRRFLDEHGEGVFHIGFVVDEVDQGEATATALGLGLLMRGRREDGSGFTYFDVADRSGGIQLSLRQGATRGGDTDHDR